MVLKVHWSSFQCGLMIIVAAMVAANNVQLENNIAIQHQHGLLICQSLSIIMPLQACNLRNPGSGLQLGAEFYYFSKLYGHAYTSELHRKYDAAGSIANCTSRHPLGKGL